MVMRTLAVGAAIGLTAVVTHQPAPPPTRTQVVMLGTGTPRPDPDRSGPATAIVVDGAAYLVDAGPGVVRRAQAAFDKGFRALAVTNLTTVFFTHLHSTRCSSRIAGSAMS
jgi:glyoxylase-like metal-dependent hydrolase (beta-lactamase superfamily II)